MNYYDNVKDSVKNGKGKGSSKFDMLREEAVKNSEEEEEEKGDGTQIEVLEEGLSSGKSQNQQTRSQPQGTPINQQQQQQEQKTDSAVQQSSQVSQAGGSVDTSGLEDKLDRIIEQNERMIEILESFGQ